MVLLMTAATASLAQNERIFSLATETRIADPNELRQRCGVRYALNGCTEFVERQLVCRCVSDASRWRIVGRARVQPRMYLANPYYEAHERLHLKDLTVQVNEHLRSLGRARFDTLDGCSTVAASAESEFSLRFDGFVRLSNLRFH
jgi:hypothetical protein